MAIDEQELEFLFKGIILRFQSKREIDLNAFVQKKKANRDRDLA